MTNSELEVINIVDKLIHAITRYHVPDYPEAKDAIQALNQLIAEQVVKARIDQMHSEAEAHRLGGGKGLPYNFQPRMNKLQSELASLEGEEV